MEKTVCADPRLSKLDEQLAAVYKSALEPLSDTAKKVTADGQHSWLRFVTKFCHLDGTSFSEKSNKYNFDNKNSCLSEAYDERIEELKTLTSYVGPFQFYQVSHFDAFDDDDAEDLHSQMGKCVMHYPQIENPKTDGEIEWNKSTAQAMKRNNPKSCGALGFAQTEIKMNVEGAWKNIISVSQDDYGCCNAHGISTASTSNIVLQPFHLLKPDELFNTTKNNWKQMLGHAAYEAAIAYYKDERGVDDEDAHALITENEEWANLVTSGDGWYLTPDGLGMRYSDYIVTSYAAGPPNFIIPWSQLKPYLNPNSPIDLP